MSDETNGGPDKTYVTAKQKIKVTGALCKMNAEGRVKDASVGVLAKLLTVDLGFPVSGKLVGNVCRTLGLEVRKPAGKSKGESRWAIKSLRDDVSKLTKVVQSLTARLEALETALGIRQEKP